MKFWKKRTLAALVSILGITVFFTTCDEKEEIIIVGGTDVTFNSIIPNGSSSQTTSELALFFSKAIYGLSANNIKLSGVAGISKGGLSGPVIIQNTAPNEPQKPQQPDDGQEARYILGISGFTQGGSLLVEVSSPYYTINGSPKSVTIFYNASSSIISDLLGTWNGGNTLTFTANDVTCSYFGFGTKTYSISGNTITFAGGAGGSVDYKLSADKRTLTISNPTGTLAAAVASGSPFTKQ
jgi:hypothetical protein